MTATTTHDGGASSATPGIEPAGITRWLADRVPDLVAPLTFTLVAGGRSNLTYRVTDDGGHAWALRRPPTGHILPTAHDMAREHKILSALGSTGVPVPATVGLCTDDSVTGAPFYVMEFVQGHIVRDAAVGEAELDPAIRPSVGPQLVDTLAALHAVDVDACGLGDLAKREDYIERQLKRWSRQFEQTAEAGVKEPGLVEKVGADLAARVPPQGKATIVHGDYRLDNVVLRDDGSVAAVLDWELCTLGEPLADLGTFLDYWTVPEGGPVLDKLPASALPGFSGPGELIDRYAAVSGRDTSEVAYFMAFGYWRLACILQGVYARYLGGAAAGDPASVEHFPTTIARIAGQAATTLAGG